MSFLLKSKGRKERDRGSFIKDSDESYSQRGSLPSRPQGRLADEPKGSSDTDYSLPVVQEDRNGNRLASYPSPFVGRTDRYGTPTGGYALSIEPSTVVSDYQKGYDLDLPFPESYRSYAKETDGLPAPSLTNNIPQVNRSTVPSPSRGRGSLNTGRGTHLPSPSRGSEPLNTGRRSGPLTREDFNYRQPRATEPNQCGTDCPFKDLPETTDSEPRGLGTEPLLRKRFLTGLVEAAKTVRTEQTPYQSLRPWQTRLIRIISNWPEAPSFELTTVEFIDMPGVGITGTDQMVNYTAISYVWGDPENDCGVLLNGHRVRISWNLARFLYALSRSNEECDSSRYYWCDAMCINQKDVAERASQVRNILRIFEKAEMVYAWFGLDTGFVTASRVPSHVTVLEPPSSTQSNPQIKHTKECFQKVAKIQESLRRISANQFFSRTWIRQEVFAARKIRLFQGISHTHEDVLYLYSLEKLVESFTAWLSIDVADLSRKAVETADPLSDPRLGIEHHFQTMYKHFQHNGTDRHGYRPPSGRRRYTAHWLKTLQDGVSFRVGDDRDRIYGVLGIITSPTTRLYVEDRPDIKPENFPISYEKTVSEVYQDVIKFLIDTDRNLDCLTIFEDRRKRAKDLPSWVPDWRKNTTRSLIAIDADIEGNRNRFGVAEKQTDLELGRLRVKGALLFGIENLRTISDWPSSMKVSKAQKPGHILFNTMAWLDDDILGLHGSYAECLPELRSDAIYLPQLGRNNTNSNLLSQLTFFVPRTARLGDFVVAFSGAMCVFVIRDADEGTYKLIGPVIGWHKDQVWRTPSNSPPWDPEPCERLLGFRSGVLEESVPKKYFILV